METILKRLQKQNEILGHLVVTTLQSTGIVETVLETERRRWGIRPVNRKRNALGHFFNFYQELRDFDDELFYKYYRVTYDQFDFIISKISPILLKTSIREPICPEQRLTICLRFLATGDEISSLAAEFRCGESTVRSIIIEVCRAIQSELGPIYVQTPRSANEWRAIASEFGMKHKFPHVLGCIDGKHIQIRAPKNSGTQFYNYKGTYSIVLLAVCDSNYRFIYAHSGSYGSESDGGIFAHSSFGRALDEAALHLPSPEPLNETFNEMVPFYFLGDDVFPRKKYLMTPYSGHYLGLEKYQYNQEHSSCRRLIENTFGIYSARWGVFQSPVKFGPEMVDEIIGCTIVLHNYLCTGSDLYLNRNSLEGPDPPDWRASADSSQWRDLPREFGFNAGNPVEEVIRMRDYIKDYITQ